MQEKEDEREQQGIDEKVMEAVKIQMSEMMQEIMNRQKQQERQKIVHNARILMESYRELRSHLENAISEVEELEEEEFQTFKSENTHLDSIRRSKLKTAMMIANIDRAMEEMKKEQTEKGTFYKFEAFKMHYIDGLTFEEVSDRLNCGKNTPSRWTKELVKRMSVKLFGIDGIEKW